MTGHDVDGRVVIVTGAGRHLTGQTLMVDGGAMLRA